MTELAIFDPFGKVNLRRFPSQLVSKKIAFKEFIMLPFLLETLAITPLLIALTAQPTATLGVSSTSVDRSPIMLKFLQFFGAKSFQNQTNRKVTEELTESQVEELIQRWLLTKRRIFAPPYSRQAIDQLTTGDLHQELTKPSNVLSSMKQRHQFFLYGEQTLVQIIRLTQQSSNEIVAEVQIQEDFVTFERSLQKRNQKYLYQWVGEVPSISRPYRFVLKRVDNTWKIARFTPSEWRLLRHHRAIVF